MPAKRAFSSVRTAMDECLQLFGYFHTKMAFSRGHLQTNWFSNFLFLLRVKQYIEGEHKLKFWLKNIHTFQNCSIAFVVVASFTQ